MTKHTPLPPTVEKLVRRFVARRLALALLAAVGKALAAGITLGILFCVLDRLWALPAGVRLAMLISVAVAMAAMFVPPIRKRIRLSVRDAGRLGDGWVQAAGVIEQCTPIFAQRLLTVTSQLAAEPQTRGSSDLLNAIMAEVAGQAEACRRSLALPRRALLSAWGLALAAAGLALALWPVGWLGMPQLAARLIRPGSTTRPVTITQLRVNPAGTDVLAGEPITLHAYADKYGDQPPVLYLSADGSNWSHSNMIAQAQVPGEFSFTLEALHHDLRYYVRCGDGATDVNVLRVQHVPAVAEFQLHYSYPAYTHRPAATASNTDGYIEAPAGSIADLTIIATEPLASATIGLGKDRLAMKRQSGDATKWSAQLKVDRDATCELELTSSGQVFSPGPESMSIHALPDRPPLARLVQPNEDLQLTCRDVVHLRYEAIDDYGLSELAMYVVRNSEAPVSIPIVISPNAIRAQGDLSLDLLPLGLHVGDVVMVSILATDSSGQKTPSEKRRILITPQPMGSRMRQRLLELREASRASAAAADSLEQAKTAWLTLAAVRATAASAAPATGASISPADAAAKTTARPEELLARIERALDNAGRSTAAVRLAMLRAVVRCDSDQRRVGGFAALADQADAQLAQVAGLSSAARSHDQQSLLDYLPALATDSRTLAGDLKTIYHGELATTILVGRANLRAVAALPAQTSTVQRQRCMEHFNALLGAAMAELGPDAHLSSTAEALTQLAQQGDTTIESQSPADLCPVVIQWTNALEMRHKSAGKASMQQLAGNTSSLQPLCLYSCDVPASLTDFPRRLHTAAIAQALRPDADYATAADLELAWSVAESCTAAPPPHDFPVSLAALLDEHDLKRGAFSPLSATGRQAIRAAAANARSRLNSLLHSGANATAPTNGPRQAEILAFQANGAQERNISTAQLDQNIAADLFTSSPEEAQTFRQALARLSTARTELEQIATTQNRLRTDTQSNAAEPSLRQRQHQLLDNLSRVPVLENSLVQWPNGKSVLDTDFLTQLATSVTGHLPATRPFRSSPTTHSGGTFDIPRDPRATAGELTMHYPLLAARAFAELAEESMVDPRESHVTADFQRHAVAALRLAQLQALHRSVQLRLSAVPTLEEYFQPSTTTGADTAAASFVNVWLRGNKAGEATAHEADLPEYHDALNAYFQTLGKPREGKP